MITKTVVSNGGQSSSINTTTPPKLLETGPVASTGTTSTGTVAPTPAPVETPKTTNLLNELKERNKRAIVGDSKVYDIVLPDELPATGNTTDSGLIVLITALFALIAGAGYVISRKE